MRRPAAWPCVPAAAAARAGERIIADPHPAWTSHGQQVFREVMERDMSELSNQDKEAVKHVRLQSRLTSPPLRVE